MRKFAHGGKSQYDAAVDSLIDDLERPIGNSRLAALFGSWGSGKSTLLAFVQEYLAEARKKGDGKGRPSNSTVVEHFDAWEHRYSASPVESVLASLVEPDSSKDWTAQLEPELKAKVAEFVKRRGPWWASTFIRVLRGFGSKELRDDEEALDENAKDVNPDYSALSQLEEHARERMVFAERGNLFGELESIALKRRNLSTSDNLWVVVDNLDRCPAEQLLDLLEAFQYAGGLKCVRLLFALDPKAAAKAITSRYSSFSEEDAFAYLDKIFFPIHWMPSLASDDLQKILTHNRGNEVVELVARRTGAKSFSLQHLVFTCQAMFRGNPRKSIHFMHQFANWAGQYATITGLPIESDWHCTSIMIALVGHMPETARMLASNPDAFHRMVFQGNPRTGTNGLTILDPWHARASLLHANLEWHAAFTSRQPDLFRTFGVFHKQGESDNSGDTRPKRVARVMSQLLGV